MPPITCDFARNCREAASSQGGQGEPPIDVSGLQAAEQNTEELQRVLKAMDLCPIESADSLLSLAEMQLVIKGVDQLKERADVDDVQRRSIQWDQQLRQLHKSSVTSSTDFMKQTKARRRKEEMT